MVDTTQKYLPKYIEGFEGQYEIYPDGRVRSLPKPSRNRAVWLTVRKNRLGYKVIGFRHEGIYYHRLHHRLLAQAFIPNPKNLPQVNHINGDKSDNRLENLEWCTRSENIRHADRTGLRKHKVGENASNAKLTNEQALYILDHPEKKGMDLAKQFSIADSTVSNLRKGKIWKFLRSAA